MNEDLLWVIPMILNVVLIITLFLCMVFIGPMHGTPNRPKRPKIK